MSQIGDEFWKALRSPVGCDVVGLELRVKENGCRVWNSMGRTLDVVPRSL